MSVYAAGFPESPDKGDTHTHNGVTYKWNGDAWDIVSSSNEGGDGPGGGGGDCSECKEYVDEQVAEEAKARDAAIEAEARERLKGDQDLEKEIEEEAGLREATDKEHEGHLSDIDARLKALESLEGLDGENIDLSDYATKAALKDEEDARISGDHTLEQSIGGVQDELGALDEKYEARFEDVVDKEWVTDNFLDLGGGTLTSTLNGKLIKSYRDKGYAFEVKPAIEGEEDVTVAFIHTSGHASFTGSVKIDNALVATQSWVYENTADPELVAPLNHDHDDKYAEKNHTHDDLDISSQLENYAQGPGVVFRKQSGNLYVSWS